jgi:hypothetical protein
MTTTSPTTTIDEQRLMGFVFRAVDEIGATRGTALVVMGDRLGYYRCRSRSGSHWARRRALPASRP